MNPIWYLMATLRVGLWLKQAHQPVMGKRWQYIEPGSEEIKGDWVLVRRSRSHGVLPWQPTYAEQWAMEAEARKTWAAHLRQRRAMLAARQPELPAVQEAVDQCLVGYTP